MESDDEEKAAVPGDRQEEEESVAGSTVDAASSRRTDVVSLMSPSCQSPAAPSGLMGWYLADLEQQRQRSTRLLPAASAVHLVPDIVVEHVSSSTFSDTGTLRQPAMCLGLSPVSQDVLEVRLSTGRQFRALSDSSVYQLERHRHSSAALGVSSDSGRRATCPVDFSASLEQFSPPTVGNVPRPPELEMEVFGSEYADRRTSDFAERFAEQLPPVSVGGLVGTAYWDPSSPLLQSLGPERSPKANWLRRHSDSNLASGHSWQVGLRVEPYPIRSHSTGDTLLNVAATGVHLAKSDESRYRITKEQIPDDEHSKQQLQHPTVPSHLWSTAGKARQERASPTVRQFFSEGSRQSLTHREELQLAARSHSENIPSREFSFQPEEMSSVEKHKVRHLAGTAESPSTSPAASDKQTKALDMSLRERGAAATERREGLVEKRLKLKKYLQTRYQMSQDRLHQSSDTDDVFMERVSTPNPSAPSVTSAAEVSEPKDLSTRSQTVATTEPVSGDGERTGELGRESGRYVARLQESSDPATFCPYSERGQFQIPACELPHLVKQEPTSPGIVPSGTSVFVFPPALPSRHESMAWYQPIRHQSTSPVPSPMSSGTSESYHPSTSFRPFFQPSPFSGEEILYPAARMRMTHASASDVSPVYLQRACSLAISTDVSPLMTTEVLPSTPPHRHTIAGPEVMSSSLPAGHLSLAESAAHRSQSGSQWHQRQLRGRRLSSGSEDLANFTCPMCSVVFPSYRHLADHMADHVTASPPPPPAESGEGEAAGSEAGGSAGPKAVHLCPICQRSFSRGDMLTRHVRLHTGIRPYECTLCSQVSKSVVTIHCYLKSNTYLTESTLSYRI